MSGIYGIYRFDGGPVEPETLPIMRDSMAYYGPDGGGHWHEGQVGLGHLLLRVTPEDSFEVQPVKKGDVTLVTFARLDNRDELLRTFDVPSADHPTTPDSSLVLEAFLRWGVECPDHINGDWQFAAWDTRRRTLFVARDHHGNTGLYYHRNAHFIAFASSQKALLSLPGVPCKPDMIKMAQILTAWPGEGWRSSHEDIHRLPPAHTMLISNTEVTTKRYWFPENLPQIRFKNDQDYVDEFREIYRQAVRVRLRSSKPIGVTLSGGLDSGSVTALAAPILAAEGKSLTAFTSIPLYEPVGAGSRRTGDEWELASATAQMAGSNINHIPLKAESVSILDGIKRQLALQDGPVHGASNMYWIHDLMKHAQDREIGVLLTGQCGNGTVSFAGNGQFFPFFLQGNYRAAAQTLLSADASCWLAIKRQIIKPLLLPYIRFYRRHIKFGDQPWRDYSAINQNFARSLNLSTLMVNDGHDPTFTISPLHNHQLAILKLGISGIGAVWHEIGAGYGIEVRDPTIDRRVIEYCLQLPDSQYRWKGQSGRLIRQSMAGLMPHKVLYNGLKGLQAADIYLRLQSDYSSVSFLLSQFEQSHIIKLCVNISIIKSLLHCLEPNITLDNLSKYDYIFTRALGVGIYLDTHK